jgi:hypothetical protein
MKSTGFNPDQLVARGVFDSLAEADAVLCDFDDARPGSTVIGVSWLQGFRFQVPISRVAALACREPSVMGGFTPAGRPECLPNDLPQGEIGRAANLAGYNKADADRPKDWVGSPNKPLMRKVNGSCDSRPLQGIACQNFDSLSPVALDRESNTSDPRRFTTGAPEQEPISAGDRALLQSASPSGTSLAPTPADSDCPWCAMERAAAGQGAAPTDGFVSRTRCARHAPVEVMERPTTAPQPAVVRDALPMAPAAALLFRGSAGADPFHPKLNPNAGVVPAYPKGRWS